MGTYSYVARRMDGQTVKGVLTADSEQAAIRQLDAQALFPLEVAEGSEATTAITGGKKKIRMSRVSVVYGQMADLLRSGVPALRSLDVLCKQTSNAALKEILREVREDVAGGQTLADAMGRHPNAFPELHTSMIRAGERGGFLEDVLARIAQFTERQNELRSKLMGAMIYPTILFSVGVMVVVGVLTFVVPRIRPLLKGDLPWTTQLIFWLSDSLREQWMYFVGVFAFVVIVTWRWVLSEAGQQYFDRFKLRAPLMGPVITLVAICRFCRILGTLLKNGVPILQALKIARDSAGNRVLAAAIDEATEAVRKGESLAVPLEQSGVFPLDIVNMIAVGEESNNLDNVLITIADAYEARTARQIDTVVKLIEPLMLIVMFFIVGFIAISLIVPILTMSKIG